MKKILIVLVLALIVGITLPVQASFKTDFEESFISSYAPGEEIVELRDQYSKTIMGEDGNASRSVSIGSIYYEATDGNFYPIQINIVPSSKANWDWEVESGHWQLYVNNDLTVAVRKNDNAVSHRLHGIAYLDVSTKDYVILQTVYSDIPTVIGNTIEWNDILYGVNYRIKYTNDSFKSDIIIGQTLRDLLSSPGYRPVDFGLNTATTYLVPIFEMNWSQSLPMKLGSGLAVNPDEAEHEEPIYFESPVKDKYFDTNLVSYMPLDYAISENPINPQDPEKEWVYASGKIRKRLIVSNDKHWLLMGVPVLTLNQMPEGSIIFDPTETLRPESGGDETNLTPWPGTGEANWEDVDEESPDTTTRVYSSSTTYVRDLYNIPDSIGSGVINFIKVYARCMGWSATPDQASLKIAIKTGGTAYESSEITVSAFQTWTTYSNQWTTNLKTEVAWTWADIDALQIGVSLRRCTAAEAYETLCTQLYVEIDYTLPPDPPTNVSATDGNYTDLVRITWTKSAGATNYKVYEGSNLLDTLGDVATYDDTAATAGTIDNAGTVTASDGSSTAHVALSLAGESTANGASRTYKVIAVGPGGESGNSNTDTGYRGVASITYQWQRSAADSDASYGNISGASSDPYNDTAAPAGTIDNAGTADASDGSSTAYVTLSLAGESVTDGAGRYFQCVLSATGASNSPATSNNNRGYRTVGTITYQWQRSTADSDASYSNISGGTTDPYNDTGAPSDGSGRYFQCVSSSTGASNTPQTSNSNRGFRSSVPTVTTQDATSVEETTATLNGNIIHLGGWPDADDRGFDWDTDTEAPYASDWTEAGNFSTGTFTHGVTGLTKGELYYYRAKANNDEEGWGYGNELTFLTKPDPPYNFTTTGGVISGQISLTWTKGTGAQKTYIRGEIGSYPTDRTDGSLIYNDTGASYNHTGLTGGDTWYYRIWSYATEGGKEQYSDSYAEAYSMVLTIPIVTTNTAEDIGKTSATVKANITSLGGDSSCDYRGFVWDTSTKAAPGNVAPGASGYGNNWTEGGVFGTGSFNHPITGLSEGQDYFVRGCLHNTVGWSYGDEITFTTTSLALWYQPNSIISGTTLPNRAGVGDDGVITWGSNPTGVAPTIGSLKPYTVITPEVADLPTTEAIPPVEMPDLYPGSGPSSSFPMYGFFDWTATVLGVPILFFWSLITTVLATAAGITVNVATEGNIPVTAIVVGFILGILGFIGTGIVGLWFLMVYAFIAIPTVMLHSKFSMG